MESALQLALRSSWQATAGVSALLAVLSHHVVFRPYEIDGAAWELVFGYIGSCVALFFLYILVAGYSFLTAVGRTLLVSSSYNVTLLISILVYRAFFHRLRGFPGPFNARLSRFYAFSKVAKTVRGCEDVQKLHAQYGDFVRIGPREVSINRPGAIRPIYEPPTRTTRSPWYAQVSNDVTKISINSTRVLKVHKQRKKGWERGLGSRAMAVYEPRVASKVDSLLGRLAAHAGNPIDMTKYIMFFGFDVMGDIGLSKDFHMVEREVEDPAIQGVHESMFAIGVFGTVPWLLSMLGKIPGAAGGYNKYTKWCHDELQEKRQILLSEMASLKDQEPRDIMTWLLKAKEQGDPCAPPGDLAIEEDARLLIIAGSDTVASAITNALFYLTKNQNVYKTLQATLAKEFPGGDSDWTYEKARNIPYLDWVIQETLRLRPSVPGGLARVTPPEGLMVDGTFIPGDTVTSVPTYTIQRDERYWPDALSFKPERWEGLSTEKAPWLPFTRGQWACSGRAVAMMEMRMVLGRIALHYDLSFPPPVTPETAEFVFQDTFTQTLPPLPLVFTPRKD
ncbi:unnamed protein product [Clonostachys chloroleuca]|uniref:Tryprostatin B 6-hydroxylase n=1 Tax=Clonostachys chloroleuca TaxID=1926264 RepID=A0AA35LUB1_9HYPO|nr:unnamed protein product [Clonostachys chloroleuca]